MIFSQEEPFRLFHPQATYKLVRRLPEGFGKDSVEMKWGQARVASGNLESHPMAIKGGQIIAGPSQPREGDRVAQPNVSPQREFGSAFEAPHDRRIYHSVAAGPDEKGLWSGGGLEHIGYAKFSTLEYPCPRGAGPCTAAAGKRQLFRGGCHSKRFLGTLASRRIYMQRRELLKFLAVGAALPVLPPSLLAHLQQAQSKVGAGYKLRTFTPAQNTLVVTMTDLIIPVTDTPGAKAARVNEWMDVVLTEWADDSERQAFLEGLAGVDKRSNELYGKNFADSTVEQQTTLLLAMDDQAASHRAATRARHGNTIPRERDKELQGNFWDVFKGATLHGYYTSEIGFTQEENLQIIPGAYHGCAPLTSEKKA
jgi:hypothetical protein